MKTFCIIGGGVSGIVSTKHCIEQNHNVILLDKNSGPGGVWYNKSYPNIQLQTTKRSYAFSDYPHLHETKLYPDGIELLHYINSYIDYFHLRTHLNFNCNVTKTYIQDNKWNIFYTHEGKEIHIESDYLIIASGVYCEKKPLTQNSKTAQIVTKNIITVEDISKTSNIFTNKNIIIIGNGPTGCDLAALAYKQGANKITIIYRSERWIFRRYLWNKYSADCFLNRFLMIIANKLPTSLFIIICSIFYYIIYIYGHGYFCNIKPPYDTINRDNIVLNDTILYLISKKKINYIKSTNLYIYDTHVNVNYTENINYDLIVNATGYKSEIKFLNLNKIPNLYNNIIHPDYNNCAFIGFAASFNWIQVSELQILWYLNYINNKQIDSVALKLLITKQQNTNSGYHYNDLAINSYNYCDTLSKDLNIKLKYSCYNFNYWFSSPDYNLWAKYN